VQCGTVVGGKKNKNQLTYPTTQGIITQQRSEINPAVGMRASALRGNAGI
jgi:hypothetical protein